MADTKISALTAATTPLAGTEVLPIVQSGVTKQVSVANLTAGRAVSADSLTLTGSPLPAASGGTGQSSYAVGDLLYASTTTALSKLADVATGNALISGGVGVAPSWGKIGLGTHVSGTLGVTNGGTGLSSVAQGDLLYGSASNTLSALAKNTTASRYLSNSGTSNNPAWAQVDLSNGVTGTLPVGNGGTGTATALTAGSVVFAGASGVYSQNNANFFWDNTNKYLLVGKASSGNTTGVEAREYGSIWVIGDNQAPVNTVQNCVTNSNSSNTDLIEFNVGQYQKTAIYVRNSGAGAGNTLSHIVFQYGAGTVAGSITSSGTTVTYGSASDSRLKNDLGVCKVSRIANVTIHDFEWKETGVKTIGAFAQELYDVVPEAVSVGTDEVNQNGELKRPWGVDYAKLVPDLIVEIQQLRARVAALENK